MGRTSGALAKCSATEELAQWLRSLRQLSGGSYSQMARRTKEIGLPTSRSTLWRAEQGISLPPWPVVEAYTRACGGNVRAAHRRWNRAAAGHSARNSVSIPLPRTVTAPQYISEPVDLLYAMRALRLKAGNPSLRELEKRAMVNGVSFLPHSTLGAVLNGTRACSKQLLLHFVRSCGHTRDDEVRHWAQAWDRVQAHRGGRHASPIEVQRRLSVLEEELRRTRAALAAATLPASAA